MTEQSVEPERDVDLSGTGPMIGRPFAERLLLSLIDAHPNPRVEQLPHHIRHDREQRLRDAMDALFNENVGKELPDRQALHWMAMQYVSDQGKRGSERRRQSHAGKTAKRSALRVRSAKQLAREASAKFFSGLADRSESLRKKWAQERKFLVDMVTRHDDVREAVETHSLAKIWNALVEGRVGVVPNWPNGSAMSEEHMLRTGLREFENLIELRRKDGFGMSG